MPTYAPVVVFLVGGLLLLLGLLRNPEREAFTVPARREGVYKRLQVQLRKAGMSRTTPAFFVSAVAAACAFSWVILFIWTGSAVVALAAIPLVFFGAYALLVLRERSYMKRAAVELVPFLRKIEAQTLANKLPQAAVAEAIEESPLIGDALRPMLVELKLQRPFLEVLRESVELLPLRSWATFVRQLEIQAETGGNVNEVISDTVRTINQRLQLQARARAEYAGVAKQQYILIGIAALTFPALAFAGLLGQLTGSVDGWIAIAASIGLMVAGILYGQRALREIERRVEN